jgi:hypothetical protein
VREQAYESNRSHGSVPAVVQDAYAWQQSAHDLSDSLAMLSCASHGLPCDCVREVHYKVPWLNFMPRSTAVVMASPSDASTPFHLLGEGQRRYTRNCDKCSDVASGCLAAIGVTSYALSTTHAERMAVPNVSSIQTLVGGAVPRRLTAAACAKNSSINQTVLPSAPCMRVAVPTPGL